MDYASIWAALIALGVMIYIVLDGFDLGIGILFPWLGGDAQRDHAMNSIAPVWDGNETWLVLGGGGLLAAFPQAYALLLPALYIPILLMLSALILRGVAFEFRFKAGRSRFLWDASFTIGSLAAAVFQGMILGTVVQGLEVETGVYAGGNFAWLSLFSLFTGVAVAAGYALLGSAWLIMKTGGELQQRCWRFGRWLLPVMLASIAAISLWTPIIEPEIRQRWFSLPNFYYLSQIPLVTFVIGLATAYSLYRKRHEWLPFVGTIGLFLLAYAGLLVSVYPYVVPRVLTYHEAAAAPSSLKFALVGMVVLLPVALAYTVLNYRVFRGKVDAADGYGH
ncbi:MAG: cytochrome d ubiquinol oxidase subunit II [Wenzhouxiangellaceae bacterium]